MKGKWKYLLYTIIFLDLIYIGFYGYNRYIRYPMLVTSRNTTAMSDSTYMSIKFKPPHGYGDRVTDHILINVTGKKIEISPNNLNFKFLKIIQSINTDKINIDYFSEFIEIRKDFIDEDIIFIYLIVGEFSEKKKKEFTKIQEKFDINIGFILEKFMKDYYNLPDCRCGFSILLDGDNIVRYAYSGIGSQIIKKIIRNELKKSITIKLK